MKKHVRGSLPAVALLVLLAACAGPAEQEEATITLAEARSEAAAAGVPVLMDFYTDW